MAFSKIFTLAVFASSLATASVLGQGNSNYPVKRSEGIVGGAEDGTCYYWDSTGTTAQCPTLMVSDLQTSLVKFDSLFPPEYDAGPFYTGENIFEVGALYLSYGEYVYAFVIQYTSMTPNNTATWVDSGADIENVWLAVRENIVDIWSQGTTFQFIGYNVNKVVDGVSNLAGQFLIQVQNTNFRQELRHVMRRRLRSQHMYLLGVIAENDVGIGIVRRGVKVQWQNLSSKDKWGQIATPNIPCLLREQIENLFQPIY